MRQEDKGLPGKPARAMVIKAVEKKLGSIEDVVAGHEPQFLADNGEPYIPGDTRDVARKRPDATHTPMCSSLNNGIAESFVSTLRRDYVGRMDITNARMVLQQLPTACEHFNEVHPHSNLKIKSPRSSGGRINHFQGKSIDGVFSS